MKKVTAMSVNVMEAASPSLIPKDRRSTHSREPGQTIWSGISSLKG